MLPGFTGAQRLRNLADASKTMVGILMIIILLISVFHFSYAQNGYAQRTRGNQPLTVYKASGSEPSKSSFKCYR